MPELVLTFSATSKVILAERTLLDAGLVVRVLPLPSVIRAGCGLCLRLAPASGDEALRLLEFAGASPEKLYIRTPGGSQSDYRPWRNEP